MTKAGALAAFILLGYSIVTAMLLRIYLGLALSVPRRLCTKSAAD